MSWVQLFHSTEAIGHLEREVVAAAAPTAAAIRKLARRAPDDALTFLHELRFVPIGRHPLEDRPLNLVEQLDQTFTILVTLRAARWLLARHPQGGGALVRLGTTTGLDVASAKAGCFAAETFVAKSLSNNRTLEKVMASVVRKAPDTRHRYVFFYSPEVAAGPQPALERPGVPVSVYAAVSL